MERWFEDNRARLCLFLETDRHPSNYFVTQEKNEVVRVQGIDNDLSLDPETTMLFGDAKESVLKLISSVKSA